MRKSTGYDTSFTDGTIAEHIKMKPEAEIRGIVTVQLLDEHGQVQREIKTENRITDSIARMAFMDYFCCRIRGNPWGRQWEYNDPEVGSTQANKDSSYREDASGSGVSYFAAPFRHFFLTDDTTPETGFARAIRGNIIGWADKSRAYAGASTVKGTINLSETLFTESNLHFVFDFPTSVANGTFQKLWWCEQVFDSTTQEILFGLKHISRNFKLDNYTSRWRTFPPATNFTPGSSSSMFFYRVFQYNNRLHVIGSNSSTSRACMAVININTEEYTEVDLHTTMGLTSTSFRPNHWMMAQENNFVYIFYEFVSNRLHRLNLDDNTRIEVSLSNNYTSLIRAHIPEIPSSYDSTLTTNFRSSTIGCKNGKLYIPVRYHNGSVWRSWILVCNPDANLTRVALIDLSTTTTPSGPFSAVASRLNGYDLQLQTRDADTWFVSNGSYTFVTDNNFNIIDTAYRSFSFDFRHVLEDTAGCAIKRHNVERSGNFISSWGHSWLIWQPVAAMTLLPSPVTKTPTNTMKIQYDFNIQRADPFQP